MNRHLGFALFGLLLPATVSAAPVDLSTWTAESYPAVAGFGAGVWNVGVGGSTVQQTVNGQPTIFYSDFNAQGSDIRGSIRVNNGAGDDDFIGFVLGFKPGDSTNAAANFLLVDWKAASQSFDFGAPSTTPGGNAPLGLAVSRVTGTPTADEFWQHTDETTPDPGAGTLGAVAELARGNTLGNVGWTEGTDYEFRFVFLPSQLQVFVNGALELDVAGSFSDGRVGFYNFSQASVVYSAFTIDPVDPSPVSAPGALAVLGGALGGLLLRRRG